MEQILHIACNDCSTLRTLDYTEFESPKIGNRCCFCGVNVDHIVKGFTYFGSEITCKSDHKTFQTKKSKSQR